MEVEVDALRLTGTVIRMVRFFDRRLSEVIGDDPGLTEITVLGAIDRGTVLGSHLARSLQLDPPRITRIVDRLVVQGYIIRGEDATDRRRSPLSLTESGRIILTRAREALSGAMTDILDHLSERDRNLLIQSLEQVRALISV